MKGLIHYVRKKLGRIAFWCAWPAIFLITYKTHRTRLFITAGDNVLMVKGWLGNGHWQLPGGGLHRGENAISGALREVREETGIAIDPSQLIELGTTAVKDNGFYYYQVSFAVRLTEQLPVKKQVEIIETAWLDWQDLMKYPYINAHTKQLLDTWFA